MKLRKAERRQDRGQKLELTYTIAKGLSSSEKMERYGQGMERIWVGMDGARTRRERTWTKNEQDDRTETQHPNVSVQ